MACDDPAWIQGLAMRIIVLLSLVMWFAGCGSGEARTTSVADPVAVTPAPRTCQQCQQVIPDQAKYCLGCGTRQKPATSTPGSR